MAVEDLRKLWRAGIGTFQVFQETYHPGRYAELHPANTIKGEFPLEIICYASGDGCRN